MGGIRKKDGARSVEEREVKEALKKKCRILAKIWDPRIKGCCFVPARSERCCAIPLQIGTRLNSVAVCLFAIAFQVFYGIGIGLIEYVRLLRACMLDKHVVHVNPTVLRWVHCCPTR